MKNKTIEKNFDNPSSVESTSAANEPKLEKKEPTPPDGVLLSHRYMSPWHSSQIVVAVGHHTEPSAETRVIDLAEMMLQCTGVGIYKGVLPLENFPEFAEAIKLAINRALITYDLGYTGTEVGKVVHRLHFFTAHLVQNGIYRFADCPPETIAQLIDDLSRRSWRRVANLDRHLLTIARQIRLDVSVAQGLIISKGVRASINVRRLSKQVGMFAPARDIQNWFRRFVATSVGDKRPIEIGHRDESINRSFLKSMMGSINLLGFPPRLLDGLPYVPFPNVESVLKELFPEGGGQTSNISPQQHAALFSTLLTWIFDYCPHLLEVVKVVREQLENGDESAALKAAIALHGQLVDEGKLPFPKLTQLNLTNSADSLQYLVRLAMTAAGNLVALNHARRATEIFGEGKPFGLYFGCINNHPKIPFNYVIDVYLQKGPQDYQQLPSNSLVAKAVEFLEQLYNLTRDLGSPETVPLGNTVTGRRMHLFTIRSFTLGGFSRSRYYISQRDYLPMLLEASGIEPSAWHEQQTPLRRAWLTLFIRRYDLPEWPAGQRALGQLDLNSTISYQSDKSPRAIGQSVGELHGREALSQDGAALMDSLAKAKMEYVLEGVQKLFSGSFTGGAFSAVILKLAKNLSENADFRKLTIERKAGKITDLLHKRGFAAETMSHVVCMAGSAAETRASAKCNVDGSLHREHGSPETCNGCINSWSNDSYLQAIVLERDRCHAAASDDNLSPDERKSMAAVASQLSNVVEAQIATAAEMKQSIESLVASWNQSVAMEIIE